MQGMPGTQSCSGILLVMFCYATCTDVFSLSRFFTFLTFMKFFNVCLHLSIKPCSLLTHPEQTTMAVDRARAARWASDAYAIRHWKLCSGHNENCITVAYDFVIFSCRIYCQINFINSLLINNKPRPL